ncbi:hypothetical protein [Salmonella enterica]|uniref:hypothetical protein n=1 Tax=Salmonella enterica TaxID=28901 RepID=UPI003D2EF857
MYVILNGFFICTLAQITPLPCQKGQALSQSGPDGLASITLPLPISAERGFALRWRCTTAAVAAMALRRGLVLRDNEHCPQHSHGVPQYNDSDEFLGRTEKCWFKRSAPVMPPIPSPASRTVTYRSRKATR